MKIYKLLLSFLNSHFLFYSFGSRWVVCMRGVYSINLYSADVRWIVLQVSDVWCKASRCILIFHLLVLSIMKKGDLKSLSIIVYLSISPCSSVSFPSCILKFCFYVHESLRLLSLSDELTPLSL